LGSYAWGKPHKYSDVDLYVVTKDDFIPKTWEEKSKIYIKIASLLEDLRTQIPMDLIVHTKKCTKGFLKLIVHFVEKL